MSLLLTNPNDRSIGISCLKTIISLFIFPGLKGNASREAIQAHVAQMDQSRDLLEVSARLETFPGRKRTVVTLTFDQVEAKLNA